MPGKIQGVLLCALAALVIACETNEMPPLPDQVYFRTNQASFNTRYYASVKDGDIYVKDKDCPGGDCWEKLSLPEGLEGDVLEISMDDINIIAINSAREVYTMFNGLYEKELFTWQKLWGFPFWFGPGLTLKEDIIRWDFSVVAPQTDGCWTDPAGNLFDIGGGNCSHIWMLNDDGQTISFNDPWLPLDYSYGMDSPHRGRFRSVSISASGSFIFVINKYGDMYTRLFDFDISGMDSLFFRYSYYDQRGKAFPAIQLPAFPWVMHPKISGRMTDCISIHKTGRNCIHRIMRVEGLDGDGHTGYYEKDVTELAGPGSWTFQRTDHALIGTELENSACDRSDETLGVSEDRRYATEVPVEGGYSCELLDFSCYNTPSTLRVRFSPDTHIDLLLHMTDMIRLEPRARGFDDTPRSFFAFIEIPPALYDGIDGLDEKTRRFLATHLNNQRFSRVGLSATLGSVKITNDALFRWTLTLADR